MSLWIYLFIPFGIFISTGFLISVLTIFSNETGMITVSLYLVVWILFSSIIYDKVFKVMPHPMVFSLFPLTFFKQMKLYFIPHFINLKSLLYLLPLLILVIYFSVTTDVLLGLIIFIQVALLVVSVPMIIDAIYLSFPFKWRHNKNLPMLAFVILQIPYSIPLYTKSDSFYINIPLVGWIEKEILYYKAGENGNILILILATIVIFFSMFFIVKSRFKPSKVVNY